MARPKKNPEYNSAEIAKQVIEAVTDAYLHPTEEMADERGHMQLKLLAEEFSITPIKIRKMLITSGAYRSPISEQINQLYIEGRSVKEICEITRLSPASVSGYLPYQKIVYNMEQTTLLAERLRKYRRRKTILKELANAISSEIPELAETKLWDALILFENYPFYTAKGLKFHYTMKSGEIFFSRKDKSITKATVLMAFHNAIKMKKDGINITGPKMLQTFGASYLYPVFVRFGVIDTQ